VSTKIRTAAFSWNTGQYTNRENLHKIQQGPSMRTENKTNGNVTSLDRLGIL